MRDEGNSGQFAGCVKRSETHHCHIPTIAKFIAWCVSRCCTHPATFPDSKVAMSSWNRRRRLIRSVEVGRRGSNVKIVANR